MYVMYVCMYVCMYVLTTNNPFDSDELRAMANTCSRTFQRDLLSSVPGSKWSSHTSRTGGGGGGKGGDGAGPGAGVGGRGGRPFLCIAGQGGSPYSAVVHCKLQPPDDCGGN